MKYEIKSRLKELRKDKGITQKALAKLMNKSETGLASWEQGLSEPCINDIRFLCKFYGVSADYLLGLDDDTIN